MHAILFAIHEFRQFCARAIHTDTPKKEFTVRPPDLALAWRGSITSSIPLVNGMRDQRRCLCLVSVVDGFTPLRFGLGWSVGHAGDESKDRASGG